MAAGWLSLDRHYSWTPNDERSPLTMLPPTFSCPRCKCKAALRAHRRGLNWFMSLVGFRPAQCFTCSKRFYLRHSLVKVQQLESEGDGLLSSGNA